MINTVYLWLHINKPTVLVLTIFLFVGALYFPISMLSNEQKLVSGIVKGKGYTSTYTGNHGYMQIKLESGMAVNLPLPHNKTLKSGDEVCLSQTERMFFGPPIYALKYARSCS
ncbi:hypothetical protein ACNPP3_004519 [Vibrio vulnificus]